MAVLAKRGELEGRRGGVVERAERDVEVQRAEDGPTRLRRLGGGAWSAVVTGGDASCDAVADRPRQGERARSPPATARCARGGRAGSRRRRSRRRAGRRERSPARGCRRTAFEVVGSDLRHVLRGRRCERLLAKRVAQLRPSRAPPAPCHPHRSGPGEVPGVAGPQSARAERDTAVDVAAEVDAEEGQVRVGHRIDQRLHELRALRPQVEVAALEGHDAWVGRGAGGHRQLVGRGARAEHGEPARVSPWACARARPVSLGPHRLDRAARHDSASPRRPAASERATAAKSTMPVDGESSAATPRACGSTACSSSASGGAAR